MCGIAAIFSYSPSAPPVDRRVLDRVCARMATRGPDGAGTWFSVDGRVALGHRRLAIIDLSDGGAQPMRSRDGRLAISFNGEIYNHRALRAELEAKGYRFDSESDTEVLLHLYADRGAAMVRVLRGMFAFALWDEGTKSMLLARDPFGIKPLYYSVGGGTLRVASEVKALLVGGGVDTEPEPAGHVGFFVWGSVPEPYTLYKGIRALPAGSTLVVRQSEPGEPKVYADLPAMLHSAETATSRPTPEDTAAALREALLDTVRHHLVADVDVGVFLSAGLDSTTLAALVAELGGKLRTVTLGFAEYRGTAQDEVPLAELVARQYGADHQTIWGTRDEFRGDLDEMLTRMDQPTIDGVNSYFVSKAAAAAGLKVALSGVGGDELFGGYPSFRQLPPLVSVASRIPGGGIGGRALRALLAPAFRRAGAPKWAGLLEYGRDYGSAYLLRRCLYLPWELDQVLDRGIVRDGWAALALPGSIEAATRGLSDSHLKVSALESTLYMRNQLLRDTDWASMSFSLEVRVPLVDWTLWERVGQLAAAGRPITKRRMAEATRPMLPPSVLTRAKSGFAIPTRGWLMREVGPRSAEPGLRGWARYVYTRQVAESPVPPDAPGARRRRPSPQPVHAAYVPIRATDASGPPPHLPAASNLHRARTSRSWNTLLRVLSRSIGRFTVKPLDLSRVDRILVLQLQQLGDSIVFTPALRALRETYPDARIDMLANEISHAVYLKCPHVGRFYVDRWARGSRWRMRPLLGLLGAIRRERYDIVVADVTQRSLRYGLVALFSGARHRIGFDVADRGFLFSTRVPLEWDASVVDANLSLARALGATVRSSALDAYFDADDEAYAASLLPETTGDGPLVSIHPASNWQAKMWVPERWAALADALVDRFHATVVFVGSSGERAYVDEVRQHMRQPATSLAGRTTLSQVGALLARCDLVIGTDSGPRHLAAGSNRPQVTLMSAHEYVQRWHFDREQEIVLRTAVPCSPCFQSHCWHQSCMRAISVEAVLAASGELLSRSTVQPVAVPA